MLMRYLNEKIANGDPAPRIPIHMACGKNGICGFSVSEGVPLELPVHRHDYFEMFITLTDDVVHVVQKEEKLLPRNTVVLVRPDDAHTQRYTMKTPGKKILNVTFCREVMKHVFDFLVHAGIESAAFLSPEVPPSRVLSELQCREFTLEFEKRLQFGALDDDSFRRNIYGFLSYVFINLFPAPENEHKRAVHLPYWLEVTCEKMKRFENFYEGLPRMVEISGKSKEYLGRSMKKYYGMTASAYINDLRLTYAMNRISDVADEDTMLGIILDSGFQSVGHFYKMFAAKYGTTPNKYKKERRILP